jgi:hypothetical protein
MIELTRDLLAGGDLIMLASQPAHQHIQYVVLIADRGGEKKNYLPLMGILF